MYTENIIWRTTANVSHGTDPNVKNKTRSISKISEVQYVVLNNLLTTYVINRIMTGNVTYMHTVCFLYCRFILNVTPYSAQETLFNSQGDYKESLQILFSYYHSRIPFKNIDQQQHSK